MTTPALLLEQWKWLCHLPDFRFASGENHHWALATGFVALDWTERAGLLTVHRDPADARMPALAFALVTDTSRRLLAVGRLSPSGQAVFRRPEGTEALRLHFMPRVRRRSDVKALRRLGDVRAAWQLRTAATSARLDSALRALADQALLAFTGRRCSVLDLVKLDLCSALQARIGPILWQVLKSLDREGVDPSQLGARYLIDRLEAQTLGDAAAALPRLTRLRYLLSAGAALRQLLENLETASSADAADQLTQQTLTTMITTTKPPNPKERMMCAQDDLELVQAYTLDKYCGRSLTEIMLLLDTKESTVQRYLAFARAYIS